MKLEINGRVVEVDDSFANLPPDQQQATVESISSQISAKPGFTSVLADKLGVQPQDPLLWGGVGAIGGLAAGPMVSAAYRGAVGPGSAGVGVTSSGAPGQKWAAKTGYGEGTGHTVREVSEEFQSRRAPVGEGKISKNIPKNKPLSIAEYQAQKAKEELEARMRARAVPMSEKITSAAPKTMGAIQGAASRFPAWLARGAAGASTGFQGAEALNKFREGDITGAALSGIGALGSGLSFIPHPITRIGGTALAIGAPMLESFLKKDEDKTEGVTNAMAAGGLAGYSKGKKVVETAKKFAGLLPPAENAARTQIIGTLPTYEKAGRILQLQGAAGRGLDFGAGLGEGAKRLPGQWDTYEPYAKGWNPTYSDMSQIPEEAYGQLTNLNVLNVVPREIRDEIVQGIGRSMEPGGAGIITTRGKDVMSAKGRPGPEPMSIITSRDTYQKGFTPAELEEYLKYMLGQGYDINRLGLGPAGAMIRKKAEGGLAHMAGGGHATPAWQRKEGQNPEGGLNAKGRASYKRETGGELKRPQPEGGPRRDSFCARMKGMKKKLTSAKTANDPDSRINKSLRAWNC